MHNNHGANANIPSNVASSQQQTGINKHRQQESNLNNIQQTNQLRYKQMDSKSTLNSSNKENVLKVVNNDNSASKLVIEMVCADDQNGSSANTSSVSSHTTKTAMCVINEIVRANQVNYSIIIHHLSLLIEMINKIFDIGQCNGYYLSRNKTIYFS